MKKIFLIIVSGILLLTAIPFTSAKNFNDLTSYQKQKYWVYIKECSPLLLNKEYNKYRICALAAFEKASQEKETNAWCTDSDSGKDFLTKGIVKTDIYPEGKDDYVKTFPNGTTYLMEGFCSSKNQYAFAQKKCSDFGKKYYAKDGACVYENQPPVLTDIGDKEVNEGELLTFSVSANDPDNDNLIFSAVGLPEGATFENQNFSWTPNYAQAGEYNVEFIVSDGESEDTKSIVINVKNVNQSPVLDEIGNKEISEGEELSFSISATDPDGDALFFSAENLPEGAVLNGNIFSWTPNYEQAGEYEITFKVSDGNAEDSESVFIAVKPVTTVKGIISGNTVWTLGNSPYIVIGHVLVEEGASLTIEPGVMVKFDGPYYLRVDGTLVANGTEEQKIVFTSNKKYPAPGDWDKIKFTDTSTDWDGEKGSVIQHSKIEYAGAGYGSQSATVRVNLASPLIESNEISNYLGYGIHAESLSSSPIIKKNVLNNGMSKANSGIFPAIWIEGNSNVSDNQIINNNLGQGLTTGIECDDGSPLINNNYIFNNSGMGISVGNSCFPTINNNTIIANYYGGIQVTNGATVTNNTISGNSEFAIHLSSDNNNVNLTGNKISGSINGIYIQNSPLNIFEGNTITNNEKGIFIITNSPVILSKNNIYDNKEYAVYLQKPNSNPLNNVTAENNWWGTTDISIINEQIYDFYDDFDLPKVIYEPFATEPFDTN